jgi:two-component system OmpR family response regulator
MRALVIEDEAGVTNLNRRLLEEEGFDVDTAGSVHEALDHVHHSTYDLVTLDIHLPDGLGLEVLEVIRSKSALTPVLIISANSAIDATVRGLDAGADDYLNKPYDTSELRARVRALMRRSSSTQAHAMTCGNVVLDGRNRTATVGEAAMDLTPKEFSLLEYLTSTAGAEVTRKELLEKVWRFDFDPGTNMVDVNVSRLRAKLLSRGATCRLDSVRGVGYVMRVE